MSRLKIRDRLKKRLAIVSAGPGPAPTPSRTTSAAPDLPPMPEPEPPPLVGSEGADVDGVQAAIQAEVEANPIIIYMKGSRFAPQCGFSARVIELVEQLGVDFQTRDCLSSEILRSGIKDFTSWPTIPQVFLGGEFVGGCDIVVEMSASGDLKKKVDEVLGAAEG